MRLAERVSVSNANCGDEQRSLADDVNTLELRTYGEVAQANVGLSPTAVSWIGRPVGVKGLAQVAIAGRTKRPG